MKGLFKHYVKDKANHGLSLRGKKEGRVPVDKGLANCATVQQTPYGWAYGTMEQSGASDLGLMSAPPASGTTDWRKSDSP